MARNRNNNNEEQQENQSQEKAQDQSKSSGAVYKMSSHVDSPVTEAGKDEPRYVSAYEPFFVNEDEALRLYQERGAQFLKPQEGDEVSAASPADGEAKVQEKLDEKAEQEAKEFAYLSSNELQPKSASAGMKAHTAHESNAMPAGAQDVQPADYSVFVQDNPMYDGVRGKYVDVEQVKQNEQQDEAK